MEVKRKPIREDQRTINVDDDYALMYWTSELGISAQKLKDAVAAAGTVVEDVKRFLRKPKVS